MLFFSAILLQQFQVTQIHAIFRGMTLLLSPASQLKRNIMLLLLALLSPRPLSAQSLDMQINPSLPDNANASVELLSGPGSVKDFSGYTVWLDSQIHEKSIPGVAMAIVRSGSVLDIQTWGVRTLDGAERVDSETVFRIASVSKTFAGTVAAKLVQHQQQEWDTPLVTVLPQYVIGTGPETKEITLRHVLSHTTGLMPHAYSNMLDSGVAYEKIQEMFQEIPTVCPPGRCYGYQNVVFSLVSDVVEVTTHKSYEEYVQQELFEPLGMRTASVGLEGYTDNANVSSAHQPVRDSWRVATLNPAYYSVGPAAGVNASIEDMILWAQANLGAFPQVLPKDLLSQQHSPVVETPRGNYFNRWPRLEKAWYGLGWRVFDYAGVRIVHHGGGVRGFRSEMVLVPELDIAMVVMFNAETPVANEVVPMFLDAILN
ncbi:MAG: serine hydrolase domain-containing protein [Gammaproteobacteria bacterium]|nr:serine hydrolase domain-containing protein [Gammaproteobacteria bacterium]MDP2139436.1 serine hydrolase domain-containing protein [Gammaproteobacteria bacterium]MDP2346272.1 serine hydrolase domain-containing protein [Gammaproteobacteria bacterium]